VDVPFNYCGLPDEYTNYETSKIVVLPVPFEKTTSWLKGTYKGPYAIIDASRNIELYDIDTDFEVYKHGIYTAKDLLFENEESLIKNLQEEIKRLHIDNKFVVTLGGEHTVTIGAVSAFSELYKDLSVVIFDAHSDMRDEYEENKFSHACVSKRILDMGIRPIQIGIRSMDVSEKKNICYDNIFFAKDIISAGDSWISEMLKRLSKNVYISIDLDAFDPSIMPSVGTPEPGGLLWHEMIKILKFILSVSNVVAFDVVELCPNNLKYSDFAAAKLTYTLLSMVFKDNVK
jgi:agmatinase